MPLFKKIKENNCEIGIWELSETLDYLIKKSDFSESNKITSRKRKKEILASRILLKNMYADLKIKYNNPNNIITGSLNTQWEQGKWQQTFESDFQYKKEDDKEKLNEIFQDKNALVSLGG